jgi:LysM repeat protein
MRRIGLTLTVCLLALTACKGDEGAERIASAAGAVTVATLAGGEPAASAVTQQYTVVSGDSLWAISQQYCTTVGALVAANGWSDGEQHPLYPGDVVLVPSAQCTSGGDNGGAGSSDSDSGGDSTATWPPRHQRPGSHHRSRSRASADEVAAGSAAAWLVPTRCTATRPTTTRISGRCA